MGEIVNLSEFFAKDQCYCLNQNPDHTFSNLFVGDETLFLQSDVDEQLLINIVFRTTVKVHSIGLVAPDDDSAPVGVKLFANLQNPGFSDVEDLEPTQKISLREQDLVPDSRVSLKLVKFLHVNSLTIYFDENRGSEVTILSGLKLFGQALDCVNVAAIHERKQEG